MQTRYRVWIEWLAVVAIVVFVGCPSKDSTKETDHSNTKNGPKDVETPPDPVEEVPRVITQVPDETQTLTEIPETHLTETQKATCRILKGDPMPDAELVDTSGQPQTLHGLLGERLTVVLFWHRGESEYSKLAATEALKDLQKDVAETNADRGISLVAINVRDSAEVVGEHVTQSETTYPVLLDTEGALFAEVATETLPRVYLLDASGKVIWFDLGFSQTTRRSLLDALEVALAD